MAYQLDTAAAAAALAEAMAASDRRQAPMADPMGGAEPMSAPPPPSWPYVPEPPGPGGVT